jgi:drug/metabolite transporter (DMT)-like permease
MIRYFAMQIRSGLLGSGIRYMFLSVFLYVAGDLLIKGQLNGMPSNEVVFFRNLFGLVFVMAVPSEKPLVLIGERYWMLLSRGMLGFLSLSLFYFLLAHAPMANAVVFLQSATIFSALIAFRAAREKLSLMQAGATVVGFVGIWLIVNPNIGATKYDLLGIALGMVSALANTSIKELKGYYDSRSIVFSYLVVGILFPIVFSLLGKCAALPSIEFLTASFVWPDTGMMAILAVVAILTTMGQIYKTRAYSLDKAGVIGTIGYSRIAFALVAGMLLGDGLPKMTTLAGIGLVAAAAAMVSYRNRLLQ